MRFIPIVSNSQNTINICYDKGSDFRFIQKYYFFIWKWLCYRLGISTNIFTNVL